MAAVAALVLAGLVSLALLTDLAPIIQQDTCQTACQAWQQVCMEGSSKPYRDFAIETCRSDNRTCACPAG